MLHFQRHKDDFYEYFKNDQRSQYDSDCYRHATAFETYVLVQQASSISRSIYADIKEDQIG
jgi:hypothetical protein